MVEWIVTKNTLSVEEGHIVNLEIKKDIYCRKYPFILYAQVTSNNNFPLNENLDHF